MYTAELTSCRRDLTIQDPKVLMINIKKGGKVFRDHCWVRETHILNKFRPKGGRNKKVQIVFDAKELIYYSGKKTLTKIKNISRLRGTV
jgi:hypothetical protein